MLPTYYDNYNNQFNNAIPQFNNQISGKFVQSLDSIMAKDVPMTGYYAIFPKADMTEIYAKNWNGQGTIDTIVYRPVVQPKEVPIIPENSGYSDIINGIDKILNLLDELLKGGKANGNVTANSSNVNPEKS